MSNRGSDSSNVNPSRNVNTVSASSSASGASASSRKDKPHLSNSHRVITSLLAGAFAGAVAKTVIAPLDRTKINFQVRVVHQLFSTRAALRFLIKSYKTDGFLALWRGNSATMARIIPYAAIQFSSHEQWKRVLGVDFSHHHNGNGHAKASDAIGTPNPMFKNHSSQEEFSNSAIGLRRFLAGSLAGVTAQSLTYPLDLTRARMAVTTKAEYKNLIDAFQHIIRDEGFFRLYRGYCATMIGVIPYAGMSFFMYETLKGWHFKNMSSPITPMERMFFGAVAGMVGQTSSYPLDIVRRRLQTSRPEYSLSNGRPYKGIFPTLLRVYREEGLVKGLYKGLSMNWVKGPVAAGLSFMVFDLTQTQLRKMLTY